MDKIAQRTGLALIRAAIAVGVTVLMATYTLDWLRELGPGHPGLLTWVWFATLAWIVVVVESLGVRADLGDAYHGARGWEQDGRVYERLGVRFFKKLTVGGEYANFLVRIFRPGFRILHDRASLERWVIQSRGSETGHVVHALMMMPPFAYVLIAAGPGPAAYLALLTVAFDALPVMIQRYNRIRLSRVLTRPAACDKVTRIA